MALLHSNLLNLLALVNDYVEEIAGFLTVEKGNAFRIVTRAPASSGRCRIGEAAANGSILFVLIRENLLSAIPKGRLF